MPKRIVRSKRLHDLSGKVFGRLTATSYEGQQRWLCRCECGQFKSVKANKLTTGNTKSCGCLRRETTSRRSTLDLTGRRFGMLIAVEAQGMIGTNVAWACECDCGEKCRVSSNSLSSGNTTSCGCRKRAVIGERSMTHGESKSPEYRSWCAMKARCLTPTDRAFSDYGGRGITVCERWAESFEKFLEDMGCRPSASHTIDRIDNNGNYEPGNCRWATKKQQARNRRSSKLITIDGETLSLAEWSERSGVAYATINRRLRVGVGDRAAIFTPARS